MIENIYISDSEAGMKSKFNELFADYINLIESSQNCSDS